MQPTFSAEYILASLKEIQEVISDLIFNDRKDNHRFGKLRGTMQLISYDLQLNEDSTCLKVKMMSDFTDDVREFESQGDTKPDFVLLQEVERYILDFLLQH